MHAAYALEQKSEHPLAKAIIAWGDANNQTEAGVGEFQAVSGNGLMGVRDGKHLQGGNWNYISGQIRIAKEEKAGRGLCIRRKDSIILRGGWQDLWNGGSCRCDEGGQPGSNRGA